MNGVFIQSAAQDKLQPVSSGFEVPGFRVALAFASLPGMTIEYVANLWKSTQAPVKSLSILLAIQSSHLQQRPIRD
jgi:hypothetical protein